MAQRFTTRPELRGSFGMVASTHWIGSAVGMGVLERGGNAFDAAVATGFALQIVEPHLNGPGGEVPIIGMAAGEAQPFVICGQGVAPAAATIPRYRDLGMKLVPGTGHLAAVVPGAFDAWMLLLRDRGTMRLREVLEPAIGYAEAGFPVAHRVAAAIHAVADHLKAHWPSSAEAWLPGGKAPMPGDMMRSRGIAASYARLLAEAEAAGGGREGEIEAARKTWREGFVAEAVDRFMAQEIPDGAGRPVAGFLTGEDMARWHATEEKTVSRDHAGVTVHKTGPWGQGPVLLQMLGLMEGFDIAGMDPAGAEFVHAVAECSKLAMADRDAFYGDPDFVDVPLERLLSPEYAEARRALVTDAASHDLRPGNGGEDQRDALLALSGCEVATGAGAGEPTFADLPEVEGDTVHLDVVDRWGNMIAATPSGGWLQSSPAVPGLGFSISTRAQMFWLDERLPGALAPGRRPRTTLSPTLVTRDGAPWLALGTPGGDQQDQWTAAVLLRVLHHGLGLQAAIDMSMFHTAGYIASFYPRAFAPGALLAEDRLGEAVLADLRARGHDLRVQEGWSIGRVCAAGRRRDGTLRAAATPRFMQAYAVGR